MNRLFSSIFSLKRFCYCAFCRAPRQVYAKKHIGLFNFLAAAAAAVCLSYLIWQKADPRLLVFFVLISGFTETFIYLRWRSSIVCGSCGFDPVIYKSSPEKAKAAVQKFYLEKIADPRFLLSRSPLLEIYKKNLQAERLRSQVQRVNQYRTLRQKGSDALAAQKDLGGSTSLL
jgi:hypothetical protein